MSRNLVVVSAGMSSPSSTSMLAGRIADAVTREVTARGEGLDVRHVELREHGRAIIDAMTGGFAGPELEDVREAVHAADGLVMVTPIFTASYSGLFKSFVDILDKDALTRKPVLIAATAGTPRHSLVLEFAMRPLFTYLRSVVMPTSVFAATDDFGADEASAGALGARIDRAAEELSAHLVDSGGGSVMGLSQRPGERTDGRVAVEGSIFAEKDRVITPMSMLLGDQ